MILIWLSNLLWLNVLKLLFIFTEKQLRALTEVKQEVVVDVIKKTLCIVFVSLGFISFAQQDSTQVYKKKVLETLEIDLLLGYYEQEGTHASVTGGIGNEDLQNTAPSVVVRIPLNEDDVLTADVGISAYTSASSSNGNPFNTAASSGSGMAQSGNGDGSGGGNGPKGTPWVASSGASRKDVLTSINVSYVHATDDRNRYWSSNVGASFEYDYQSFGFGGGFTQLWNEKNTELSLKAQVYLDQWKPIIPTEIHEFDLFGENFLTNNQSYFSGVSVLDENGNSVASYLPSNYSPIDDVNRNSYAVSLEFSQVLSKRAQFSLFMDLVKQQGWLANPLQRVYFADQANFYIGNVRSIVNYEDPSNTDVFHLADDIERLPRNRFKYPFGMRLNYYVNEYLVVRSYVRRYTDDWGVNSNTVQLELPIKFNLNWKLTPSYRYYDQTAADYFAPYDQHLSSQAFYTSDYDLSAFSSHQIGGALVYTDVLSKYSLWKLSLKNISIRFQNYQRSDGLSAFSIATGFSFVLD